MESKTNSLRLIDMAQEYKPVLLNNANHTSFTIADTELSEWTYEGMLSQAVERCHVQSLAHGTFFPCY